MRSFDVIRIGTDLYLIVQAEHLLNLNTVVLVPVLPSDALPTLSKLTVDIQIDGDSYNIRAHMPLTVDARRLQNLKPVHHLAADESQKVMDGLYTILWGL